MIGTIKDKQHRLATTSFILAIVAGCAFGVAGVALVALPHTAEAGTLIKPSNTVGLRGWWKFDEGTGGSAADSSGQGNNGTLTFMDPGSDWVAGQFGTALDFDGLDDHVNAGNDDSLNPTSAITVLGWIYPRNYGPGAATIVERLYASSYILFISSAGESLVFNVNGADSESDTSIIALDTWQHVAVTYDGTDVRFYVDALPVGTVNNPGSISTDAQNVQIGNDSTLGAPFDGAMDDIRIYNRALSQAEIAQIMRGDRVAKQSATPKASGEVASGLSAWWTLDGADMNWGTGRASDASGNAYHAQAIGMATRTSPIDGRMGQGLRFYSAGDHFRLPASLPALSDFTMSAWVRLGEESVNEVSDRNPLWYGSSTDQFLLNPPGGSSFISLNGFENTFGGSYPIGKWKFFTVMREGTTARYLEDGALVDSWDVGSAPLLLSGTRFGEVDGGAFGMNGDIDDIRIYSRALPTSTIMKLYENGRTYYSTSFEGNRGLESGLSAWWTFDGPDVNWGSGRVADKSGAGNHGYVSGLATTTAGTGGKAGQAFIFDGVNDSVEVGATVAGVRSVAFWVAPGTLTENILALSATHDIELSAGTLAANGFSSPTIYVDGAAGSVISDTKWHHVVVTTGTSISADAITLGRSGGAYFQGALDGVRLYTKVLSAAEVAALYAL